MFEALTSGERWHDCDIEWDFDLSSATTSRDIEGLYDQRIRDIREKYDFIELSWGGGHDSSYLIEIAYRNHIQIDMISMIGYGSIHNPATTNLELKNNFAHVDRYVKKFPETQVCFLDLTELWEKTKKEVDKSKWVKCFPTLDDICGQSCDAVIGRSKEEKRCLITGKGWKQVVYDPTLNLWSMFQTTDDLYKRLAQTSVCDYVPFFDTPDIIVSVCEKIREIGVPSEDTMWIPSSQWTQKHVLYSKPALPVWHGGKISTNNEFTEPKMDWFVKNGRPTQPELHKEYWQWISHCNDKIHVDDLAGGRMPIGFYPVKSVFVDLCM